ncbi:RsmB/NOP family class I SAM-dependent RNA methyltransferase [Thalassococcus lentus]|uniref:RsmB/NOP family class I SAM-dependent RNA methyltransferase n=1 Tax=Thalassococcus lentus TaxID=1210524 RepID=A0ABT4XQJ8_9RHOB|nr:RsmB/NOP family class I SAM-dependent RNA methyltransferase [Thalassococcus lentus]MDA7424226.1 RsmB/NOP family class I SAM-dependent RNA methyltransferase [Thalassococcus lentus]
MTPAARVQAAIEVLDRIGAGAAAEQALLGWSRGARYAGSKDRRAVRDHVFDVVRRWRSCAELGGAETGRARMIGLLRSQDADLDAVFSGQGHAPAPLTPDERVTSDPPQGFAALDLPDWLGSMFEQSLGDQASNVARTLQERAPVFLRVNGLKSTRASAQQQLRAEGIETTPVDVSPTALRVDVGARAVARSAAYLNGVVELQDAASQAVVDALPLRAGMRVLDYCAGGGGKALAMAARLGAGPVEAHDIDPKRMTDLPARAQRAAADVVQTRAPSGVYDLVLADAPCSGSGAWRRAPEGKWRLSESGLAELCETQAEILDTCAGLVAPGGILAYATCSVLNCENQDQATAFVKRHPGWTVKSQKSFLPGETGDGLFVALIEAPI